MYARVEHCLKQYDPQKVYIKYWPLDPAILADSDIHTSEQVV